MTYLVAAYVAGWLVLATYIGVLWTRWRDLDITSSSDLQSGYGDD